MGKGYLKIDVDEFEDMTDIYSIAPGRLEIPDKFTAWCDLLFNADNSGKVKHLTYSLLSGKWTWSHGKVKRFLSDLEFKHRIQIEKSKTGRTFDIYIIDYTKYQDAES